MKRTNMDNRVYKIRSTLTGKFSKGGDIPTFSKIGKSWKELSHVNAYLSQLSSDGRIEYAKHQAEIVTFEIREVELEVVDLKAYTQEVQRKNEELRSRLENVG